MAPKRRNPRRACVPDALREVPASTSSGEDGGEDPEALSVDSADASVAGQEVGDEAPEGDEEDEEDEEDEVRPVRRPAKRPRGGKRAKSAGGRADGESAPDQTMAAALDRIFSVLDPHDNGRITARDIFRVADDHGLPFTTEEVNDCIRFWDSSGTRTISRQAFTEIATECKFVSEK